jgi:hypothetical protein
LKDVPLQTLDPESFFSLLGIMQLELLLTIDALTLSICDEADRYGLRITERRKAYNFQDFKTEAVKMFGTGIVLMTDFEIESALKQLAERIIITKYSGQNKLEKSIKLKKIEHVLAELRL